MEMVRKNQRSMRKNISFTIFILLTNISICQNTSVQGVYIENGLKDGISKILDVASTSFSDEDSHYVRSIITSIDNCSVLVDIHVDDSKDTMVELVVIDITVPYNNRGGYVFQYSNCIVAEIDNRQIFIHDPFNIQKIYHVPENLDVDRQDVRFRNGMSQYYLYKDGKLHFSPLTPPLIEEIVPLLDIEMDDGQSDDK